MSTTVTIEGNLGGDVELRFTASSKAVASFSVVSSKSRKLDDGTWEDTEVTWRRITAWDSLGENCAESLNKGDAVVIVGREYLEEWTTDAGKSGVTLKVNAYNVAPSLKRHRWSKQASERSGVTDTGRATDDPWAAGPVGGTTAPADTDPPF